MTAALLSSPPLLACMQATLLACHIVRGTQATLPLPKLTDHCDNHDHNDDEATMVTSKLITTAMSVTVMTQRYDSGHEDGEMTMPTTVTVARR